MPSEPTGPLLPDEALRDAYSYFMEAVETLAAEPEAQCEAMGDYNVGWEVKDDVAAGRCLTEWDRLAPGPLLEDDALVFGAVDHQLKGRKHTGKVIPTALIDN